MKEGKYEIGLILKTSEFDGLGQFMFLHRSVDFLTKLGGSTSWVLDPLNRKLRIRCMFAK